MNRNLKACLLSALLLGGLAIALFLLTSTRVGLEPAPESPPGGEASPETAEEAPPTADEAPAAGIGGRSIQILPNDKPVRAPPPQVTLPSSPSPAMRGPSPRPASIGKEGTVRRPSDLDGISGIAYLRDTSHPLVRTKIACVFITPGYASSLSFIDTDESGDFRIGLPWGRKPERLKLQAEGCPEVFLEIKDTTRRLEVIFRPFSGYKRARLLTTKGVPIPFASVTLPSEDSALSSRRTTDLSGTFHWDGWPTGRHEVEISFASVDPDRKAFQVPVELGKLGAEEVLVITVDAGRVILVKMVDPEEKPVSWGDFWFSVEKKPESEKTDPDPPATFVWIPLRATDPYAPPNRLREDGLVFLADLPERGWFQLAGYGSKPFDFHVPAENLLEELTSKNHCLYGELLVDLESQEEGETETAVFEPFNRYQVLVLDDRSLPVEGAFMEKFSDRCSVRGLKEVGKSIQYVGDNHERITTAERGFRPFIFRREGERPGTYSFKVSRNLDVDLLVLSPRGAVLLKSDAVRNLKGPYRFTVSAGGCILGEIRKEIVLTPLEHCVVTVEGDGTLNQFFTGSNGSFCIFLGDGVPRKLSVEHEGQTQEIENPEKGFPYRFVLR